MYYENGEWNYALVKSEANELTNNKCILTLHNGNTASKIKPEYYTHFTLAKFIDGKFVTLDYEYDPKFKEFPEKLVLAFTCCRLCSCVSAFAACVACVVTCVYPCVCVRMFLRVSLIVLAWF